MCSNNKMIKITKIRVYLTHSLKNLIWINYDNNINNHKRNCYQGESPNSKLQLQRVSMMNLNNLQREESKDNRNNFRMLRIITIVITF